MEYTLTSFQRTICFLLEMSSALKSWANFTSNYSTVITISYPNPKPLGDLFHWLVALACQQLDETENRVFEVRKLSSQKNQFVNLNHPGNGKNYSTV